MTPRVVHRRNFLKIAGATVLSSGHAYADHQEVPTLVEGVDGAERDAIVSLGRQFLERYRLPGLSLAMSFRGKLKLRACFGYANLEQKHAVRPQHQFRIASVSKPISSVAVLRLVEQGKLELSDRPFSSAGQLAEYADVVSDPAQRSWLEAITVRHLLEHSSGGWSNRRGEDPMFAEQALGLSHAQLIRWTLANRTLKHVPGTNYAYSNFGYCLLGRVIEKVTGETYESAVRRVVLRPCSAHSTQLGERMKRADQEVTYYDRFDPYGKNMDVQRMDAHGGWISTPTDLLRFASCVDGFQDTVDLLSRESIEAMSTPRLGGYALGWKVNDSHNWWHTGGFNGGSSILARIHDGHCWAVVVNTRSDTKGYYSSLDKLPWDVKNSIGAWGDHDFFDEPNRELNAIPAAIE